MELIVLNIGFDLGILSPEVFAMMVLMALATTFMTGPALNGLHWFQRKFGNKPDTIPILPEEQTQQTPFRLLISFGQPKAGARLRQKFLKRKGLSPFWVWPTGTIFQFKRITKPATTYRRKSSNTPIEELIT
jgi:hypothetical protein